jgi:DNA primase small subunit
LASTSSLNFIQRKFAEHYEEHGSEIQPPSAIEKREFGFIMFNERVMIRHKTFKDMGGFASFVKEVVPSNVYYSGAYYEQPEEKMDEKGWLGADLIFDIDADHMPTPCGKIHDRWVCSHCGMAGRGPKPEKCPACGGQKFDEKTWPCEVCLSTTKEEAKKLIDLLGDFGLSPKETRVFFSGHRGYHVQVESERIRMLDSLARREIVDYVLGLGLDASFHGLECTGKKILRLRAGPSLFEPGWSGRIAKGTRAFFQNVSRGELEQLGLEKKVVDLVSKNREVLTEGWEKQGPWLAVRGIGVESWRRIVQKAIEMSSAKIDTVVTTDVHRLIRLAGTLHGKTGLTKTEVSISDLEHFDPFRDAVAFKKGAVTVFVLEAPKFRVGDEVYGPIENRKVELPTAAAMLLLCKGLAETAGEK